MSNASLQNAWLKDPVLCSRRPRPGGRSGARDYLAAREQLLGDPVLEAQRRELYANAAAHGRERLQERGHTSTQRPCESQSGLVNQRPREVAKGGHAARHENSPRGQQQSARCEWSTRRQQEMPSQGEVPWKDDTRFEALRAAEALRIEIQSRRLLATTLDEHQSLHLQRDQSVSSLTSSPRMARPQSARVLRPPALQHEYAFPYRRGKSGRLDIENWRDPGPVRHACASLVMLSRPFSMPLLLTFLHCS